MNIDLSGKTALVTGSTQGIGYAIAQGLADSGARVVVNGRSADRVDDAVARLRKDTGADVLGMPVDVTTAEGVENAEEAAMIRTMRCTKIQGYHFGRPMPAEDARALMQRTQRRRA